VSWNRHHINNLILNPALIAPADIDQLQQLCMDYPYSGIFALIYLEALHHHADIRLGKELPKYAFLVSDRARLFQLLHQTALEIEAPKSSLPPINSSSEDQAASTKTKPDEEKVAEPISKEGSQVLEQEVEHPETHSNPLDKLIKESVASTMYSLELEKLSKDPIVSTGVLGESAEGQSTQISEVKSFTDWLGQSLLEKLTPTNTGRIERPTVDFYSPVKKAKESVNSENIPVSETLAKIFVIQGNYPKAVQIYEQLILTFPEKKTYFAGQIRKLTKKEA
jgi:hypothetical protein